jgi:hypothetical protein
MSSSQWPLSALHKFHHFWHAWKAC